MGESVMSQLHAMVSTFLKDLRTNYSGSSYFFKSFGDVTRSAVIAWIVYLSGDRELLAYICVGVFLLAIWTGVTAMGGWSLSNELSGRTLDFILTSHTPMPVVLFSKILAQMAYETISGIIALTTVFLVVRELPEVANITFLLLSLFFVLVGLAVTGFFFTPLLVLAGGKPGFFMGIIPFSAILSGFILPVNQLPFGLEVVARWLPASWAMESVWQSIKGTGSWWLVISNWGMCLLVSAIWFIVTYLMCKVVEKRIRIKGTLGTF
jgi:ABC-type multidrug transport system permease subunit